MKSYEYMYIYTHVNVDDLNMPDVCFSPKHLVKTHCFGSAQRISNIASPPKKC